MKYCGEFSRIRLCWRVLVRDVRAWGGWCGDVIHTLVECRWAVVRFAKTSIDAGEKERDGSLVKWKS